MTKVIDINGKRPGDDYLASLDREVDQSAAAHAGIRRYPGAVRAIDAPPQPPLRWLVEGFWPATELGLFVGDGGTFKSSVAVHVACAIAGGEPVFDCYPTERRPVMIISSEDPLGVVLMRCEAFCVGHGWDREKVLGNVHIIATDVVEHDAEMGDACLNDAGWQLHLKQLVEEIRPGFIVFDPWAELLGADENSNTEVRPAIKYLRRLAVSVDAALAVVHHMGKMSEGKRQMDRIRGASALPSASRVTFFFEFEPDAVRVENLKMSRTPRIPSFVIKRDIASDPANRAQWTSARFTVENAKVYSEHRAESAEAVRLRKAREFVIAQLRMASPRMLNTSNLKSLAKGGSGIRNADLSTATAALHRDGLIGQRDGKQGSKLWYFIDGSASPDRGNDVNEELELTPSESSSLNSGTAGRVRCLTNSGPAQPAQSSSRSSGTASEQRVLATAPPKGGPGRSSPAAPDAEAGTGLDPDDIQALIDEELGKREFDA